ncbi:uncharacterized protein ZHAS_00021314 [Anopheles sinensis]|uniref:Uncharacterized protein n=1 Tax=Anopheles sinensis TaxID=74873 RepID=A0A084WS25_ANOSI|nr:uncharacterized protein ZHAS_00021314 [Anopheles sinensis]
MAANFLSEREIRSLKRRRSLRNRTYRYHSLPRDASLVGIPTAERIERGRGRSLQCAAHSSGGRFFGGIFPKHFGSVRSKCQVGFLSRLRP